MTNGPSIPTLEGALTVGSLFSGIGALEQGLEMTGGFRTVWQVEQNDYARCVLAKHWPNAVRHEDVRHVGRHNLEPVDLICGGPPCQPFSSAGKSLGARDHRNLWGEFLRVVGGARPGWVVAENVPRLLTIDGGRTFGNILDTLASFGYSVRWDVLAASAFGAPHRRERLFLVAHADGARLEGWQPAAAARRTQRELAGRAFPVGASWPDAPGIPGVGYGAADWVHRLRALGNAVVPQVAQFVGERILAAQVPA